MKGPARWSMLLRMLSVRLAATIAVVLPALAVSACGSGGEDTLSRSALDAKANAICKAYAAKLNAVDPGSARVTPGDLQGLGAAMAETHAINQRQDVELAALKPDDKTKAQWKAYLAASRAATAAIGQMEAATKANDVTLATTVWANLQRLDAANIKAAFAVGANACALGTRGG